MNKNAVPGWVLPVIFLLIPIVNWVAIAAQYVQFAWLLTMFLMLLFCVVAGLNIVKRPAGALVDDRNVMSLSRLQMLLWTILVLSAFFTAAIYNLDRQHLDNPLVIRIPSQLWLAMGISTVSLVGTPLILGQKSQQLPSAATLASASTLYPTFQQNAPIQVPGGGAGAAASTPTNKGLVFCNTDSTKASWADLVTGDELANGAHLDLAKVQMLFFTVVIGMAYAYALWKTIGAPGPITVLPPLDDSTIALLGISHSGYLVNKAVPRG